MPKAGVKSYPPEVQIQPRKKTSEQIKYEKMWAIDDYRRVAPGEQTASIFLEQAKPAKDSTVLDFGCGTGRGGLMIALMGRCKVTLVDFAENALDDEVKEATITQPDRLQFLRHDLNHPLPVTARYGYCTDVMEHIPPDEVDQVLANILVAAQSVFFMISTVPDVMGERIGEPLHLTVQDYSWWLARFREQNCVVHWSHNADDKAALFYVTSWSSDITREGKVNTELEKVIKNIKTNIEAGWQQIHPHEAQDTEIMLLCGGPSLNDYEDEIRELRTGGMPMVTTNGTYNWALERGMTPSLQLVLDAREFNKRFTHPVVDDCKYLIASQCHPTVLEGLPKDRTWLWHVTLDDEVEELLDEAYPEWWFPVPGGSTVTLRGFCLLRMLGFLKIHVYGFDSCYRADEHHAYDQPENDSKVLRIGASCRGTRTFLCDPWMFTQAKEFIDLIRIYGDEFALNIKGDGLIAHIIETGAKLAALDEEDED